MSRTVLLWIAAAIAAGVLMSHAGEPEPQQYLTVQEYRRDQAIQDLRAYDPNSYDPEQNPKAYNPNRP